MQCTSPWYAAAVARRRLRAAGARPREHAALRPRVGHRIYGRGRLVAVRRARPLARAAREAAPPRSAAADPDDAPGDVCARVLDVLAEVIFTFTIV